MGEKTIEATATTERSTPPPGGFISKTEAEAMVDAAVRAAISQYAKNQQPVDVHVTTPGVPADKIPSFEQSVVKSITEAVRDGLREAAKNNQGPTATATTPSTPSNVSELEKRLAQLETADKGSMRVVQLQEGQPIPKDATLMLPLNSDQQQVFFSMMEKNGFIKQSQEMQGKKYENTWKNWGHSLLETRISVRHVVYATVIAGVLWLLYEGVAYAFDLPGLLHDSNPAGADAGGGRRLRAA